MDRISKETYPQYVEQKAEKSPIVKDTALAFLVGGTICAIGQAILEIAMAEGLSEQSAGTLTTIVLIGLSALLTGLNVYNKIARFAGAGTLIPVTGFANAVVSPAIDFKSEGMITGMACKMFLVAGPVIVYGMVASAVYGILLLVF